MCSFDNGSAFYFIFHRVPEKGRAGHHHTYLLDEKSSSREVDEFAQSQAIGILRHESRLKVKHEIRELAKKIMKEATPKSLWLLRTED